MKTMKRWISSSVGLLAAGLCLFVGAESAQAVDSFDAKGGAHIAVWRPSNGTFYVYNRATGATKVQQWGLPGDIPVPADYDGDGTTDFAIFRPSDGTWWAIYSSTGQGWYWQWGQRGDIPVPGNHYTNSIEFTVFRPSNGTWYSLNIRDGAQHSKQWGQRGDVPVAGNFSVGGSFLLLPQRGFAVWRPASGNWYISDAYGTKKYATRQWGASEDKVVAGDYNGDGVQDLTVWRPSNGTWYSILSNYRTAPAGGTTKAQQWGQYGDIPIAMDYDDDGKDDFTVWRPENGTWYILKSSVYQYEAYQWGQVGDIPVPYYVSKPAPVVK